MSAIESPRSSRIGDGERGAVNVVDDTCDDQKRQRDTLNGFET
jgi:hypothetical protein